MDLAKDLKECKSDGKEERTRRKNPTEGYHVLSLLVFRERNLLGDSVCLVDLRLGLPGTEKEKALILALGKELGWSMRPDG